MGTVTSVFSQEVVSTIPAWDGSQIVYICVGGTVTVQIDNTDSGHTYKIRKTQPIPTTTIEDIAGTGGTITSAPINLFSAIGSYTIAVRDATDDNPDMTFTVVVSADPTAPTLTLSQPEGAVNAGTSTSISATAGTAGSGGVAGCDDGYEYSIDGGTTWTAYNLGDPIATTSYKMPSILIKAFRSHVDGLGCYAENIYTWTINSRVHDGTGATGSYYNIQDAINASATASGDILLADNSTYVGNIEINKSITLKSDNLHGAVIQTQLGFNAGSGYGGITFLANNATLEGFRIEQSVSQAVIHTHNSNYVTIKNNEVVGTAATPDGQPRGVDIGYAGVNSDHVTIQGNTFTNTACGAYVNQATNVVFDNNTVALVSGSSWPTGAVVIDGTWPFNNIDVTNNTINSATDYLLNYGTESNVGKVTYSGNTLNNGKLSNWIVRNTDKEIFYETLNGATNNANANDHIDISEGTTSISTWTTVNKTLTIQGAGITKSIVEISPSWFNNGNQHALALTATNTSIKGVKFLVTGKGSGNILGLQGNNLTIENNRFEGAYVFGDGQVSRATVWSPNTGISFKNNEIESLRQPGYISGSSGTIDGNSINNTRGWVIETVGTLAISNNTFGTNIDHIAIIPGATNLSGLTITGNDFSGSATWYIENQDAGNGIANASCNWYGTTDYSSILAKIKGKVTFVPYQSTKGGSCDQDFAEPANLTLTYTQASEDIHVKFDVTNNNLELKEIPGGLSQAQIVALYQNLAVAMAGGDPLAIQNAAFAVGDDIITEYYYMDGMTKKYLKTIGGNELAKNKYWDKYLVRTSDSERFPDWAANKTTVNVNEYGSHTNPGTGSVASGWLNDVLGRDVYVTVTFIHDGNVKSVTKTVHIDAGPIKNLTTGYGYPTIQQAINASNTGDRIGISTGTYTENVDATAKTVALVPGNSPGCVTINGNLTLNGSNTLEIEANGTVACSLYDQFIVNGTVTLNGAILDLTVGYTPLLGDSYTVIDNDSNDAVIGQFSDKSSIKVGGDLFHIDYKGGTGNDVVVTKCSGGVENNNTGKEYCSIQDAINEATAGDIIKVTASSFTEPGQIVVDRDVTIEGNGKASTTVINNFTKSNNSWQNDGSAWIVVNDGVTATFKDMKLDGNGKAIPTGILFRGGGTVSGVHMTNISDNTSYNGSAIRVFKGAVTVTGSEFDNIGRSVIHVRPGVMVSSGVNATITNNTFTGNGLGDKLNYAADVASGSNVTITGNTMSNFKGEGAGYGSAGLSLYAFDNGSESTSATIKNNFMDDNYLGVSVGPGYKSGMTLTVEENSFTNTIEEALDNNASVSITAATCNWYGSTQLSVVSAKVNGNVTYTPWLNNGSDNDGMPENGFQPVANSCNWSPVSSLTVSSTPMTCAGNDGTIKVVVNDGSAPYNVAWSGGSGTTSTEITFINISNGTYVITVTDNYGNTTTASVAVGYAPIHNTTQNTYYTTIQGAINAASNGDVIDVCAGTYNELLTIDRPLTLNGAKKDVDPRPSVMSTRVIDGASESIITGTKAQTLVTIKADNVVINGFEFKQTGSGNTAPIVNNDKSPKYTDLTFKNNIIYSTGGGNAMRLYGGDNFLIEGNYLQDIGGEGIVLRNGNNQATPAINQKIKDNDIKNVGGVSGGAINVYGEKDLEISGNIIDTKYQGISIGAGGPSYYDMDNINVHHNTINWDLVNTGGATKFALQVNGLGTGVNIHNNIIQQTGSNPSAGYPLIRVGYDADNSSVTNPTGLIISDNYLSMVSGGTGHYMYIGNNITNAITGTCNWWGTTNVTTIASYIRDVNTKLSYASWLTSGGNSASVGFDPTGQCNGSPVVLGTITPTDQTCSTSGTIEVNWTGGVANYTVAWSGTASGSTGSISVSPYTITGLTAGTYTITVTDSYSNSAVSSIITVGSDMAAPMAAITNNSTPSDLTCSQTSVSVTASGGVSYAWSGGLGTNANAAITAAGTYTVTVTGGNGCTATASITINYLPVTLNDSGNNLKGYYATIQAAVTAASANDIIEVCAGTYPETVNVNKDVTINGPNKGIDPNTDPRGQEAIIENGGFKIATNNKVVIDGFTIYKNTTAVVHGVDLATGSAGAATVTVQNNIFKRESPSGGQNVYGVYLSNSSGHKLIQNNYFTGSPVGGFGGNGPGSTSSHKTWRSGVFYNGGDVDIIDNVFKTVNTAINAETYTANSDIDGNTFDNLGTAISFGGVPAGYFEIGDNNFMNNVTAFVNLSTGSNDFRLDISAGRRDGKYFKVDLFDVNPHHADLFSTNAKITNQRSVGMVYYVKHHIFVRTSDNLQTSINYAATAWKDILEVQGSNTQRAESVTINKSLELHGAQYGNDVTTRSFNTSSESRWRNANGANDLVTLQNGANDVVIDGFSLYSNTNSKHGIYQNHPVSGLEVRNNFIRNFSNLGVSMAAGAEDFTIEKNDFQNNYAGVYFSDSAKNGTVSKNNFDNHVNGPDDQGASIVAEGTNSNISIENNKMTGNGKALYLWNLGGANSNITFTGNSITGSNAGIVNNKLGYTQDAPCNWWGTDDYVAIQAMMTGLVNAGLFLADGVNTVTGPGFVSASACIGSVYNTTQQTYHGTIQDAIDNAIDNDVITVDPGTYAENVIVDKDVTILGPNASVDPCTGARGAEAIVTTAVSDIAGDSTYSIFDVQASNVIIKGFTIDGDNTLITTGKTSTNGADIDIAVGITRYVTGDNLTVTNNIIQNVSYLGVELYDYPAGVASSGNTVSNNKIQNLGTYDASSGIANWGIGVLLYNNQYTAVTNNCMTNVRSGVQTGNFYRANPGSSAYQIISNNTIEARRTGIFHNLFYSSASPFTVSNNTITALGNANETRWAGILNTSMQVAASTLSGNSINGAGTDPAQTYVVGIDAWNDQVAPIITGGSITNVMYGINVNNYEGYLNTNANNTFATIDGVNISNASVAGVQVNDNPANSNNAKVTAEVKNVTIGGNTPIGVLISGNDAYANVHDNTISAQAFGIQSTGSILSATNGLTLSNNDITMTGQTYNSNPTTGIVLHKVTGTHAATVSGNDIAGSMYGYSVYNLNTGTATDITGGTITGVMQGVALLNWDPVANTYGPTNANVSNISMSGFTGTSTNPDINFHAGVYSFTGGSNNSATITSTLSGLTIDGTGKIQADCGGIVAADFSTGSGTRQTITINENTIQNNANRGILARGGNAIVNVNRNTLTNNGGNPYGLGGNDGFGIIGHKNVQLNIWNNFITNPASVSGGYNVSAMAIFNGASITATENNLDQNGNTSSWLANNMDNTGTFTANCNWWGSSDLSTILSKQNGNVVMCTYLTDGTDGSGSAGFQPSVACENRLSGSITYTGSGLLIQNSPAVNVFMNGVDGIKPYTFEYNINGGATQTAMTIGGANNVGVPQGTSTPGTYVWHLTKVTDANGCEGDIDVLHDEVTIVVIPLTDLPDLVPTHGAPLNAQIGGTVVDGYIIIKNGGNGPTFDVNTFGWPKVRVPKSLSGFNLQYNQGATMSGSVPVNNWDCTWTDKGAEWEIEYKNNPINAGSDIKIGYTIKGTGAKPASANMNVRVVDSTGGDNNSWNNKNTRVFIVK